LPLVLFSRGPSLLLKDLQLGTHARQLCPAKSPPHQRQQFRAQACKVAASVSPVLFLVRSLLLLFLARVEFLLACRQRQLVLVDSGCLSLTRLALRRLQP
jgi:hypothetical protein